MALIVCVPVVALAIWFITGPPGIGDVGYANSKIKIGMTKAEVRALLGTPHRQCQDEWSYWETRLGCGNILRVSFGDDQQVISSEGWGH